MRHMYSRCTSGHPEASWQLLTEILGFMTDVLSDIRLGLCPLMVLFSIILNAVQHCLAQSRGLSGASACTDHAGVLLSQALLGVHNKGPAENTLGCWGF